MTADFLSLPTTIYNLIWDFCGTKAMMALASTCRMFHTEIERCTLVVNAECLAYGWRELPIFFPDQCGSVFLTCETSHNDARFIIMSRNRQQNGKFGPWDCEARTKHNGSRSDPRITHDILFRHDPSREYKVRDKSCPFNGFRINLRKLFMTSEVTPAMKGALSVCSCMGYYDIVWKPQDWDPHGQDRVKESEMKWFLMKLFLFGCMFLSEESSPIRRFFEIGQNTTQEDNESFCLIYQIINLFQQTLEQKEPNDCVRRPLTAEETIGYMGNSSYGCNLWPICHGLPEICLKQEFTWKQNKRRHWDQDKDIRFNDELVFVARIPMAPYTESVILSLCSNTEFSSLIFVLFVQKRQDGLNHLENSTHGKVFIVRGRNISNKTRLNLQTEYEACFLYVVPGKATTIELSEIHVTLNLLQKEFRPINIYIWMDKLLERRFAESESIYNPILSLLLLRDGARALMGPGHEQYKELKEAFEMIGLDLTAEGLECIVSVCNILFQYSPYDE